MQAAARRATAAYRSGDELAEAEADRRLLAARDERQAAAEAAGHANPGARIGAVYVEDEHGRPVRVA